MSAPRTCECMTCKTCHTREWARNRYRLKAYGQWDPHADLEAVRAHIAKLREDGVGITAIAAASGVVRSQVERIANGRTTRIGHSTATRLLAVDESARAQMPAFRVTRRLRALNAIGYSTRHLAGLLNTSQEVISDHLIGDRKWVQVKTFASVVELYDRVCMTPGGNKASERIARSRGYVPPLGWDDIDADDEPRSEVAETRRADEVDAVVVDRILAGDHRLAKTATKAERVAVVARWQEVGRSLNELERLTGWEPRRYLTKEVA